METCSVETVSCDRLLHHHTANTRDAFFESLVEERQAFVVEAHEVQDRGVQVGDVARFIHGGELRQVQRGFQATIEQLQICVAQMTDDLGDLVFASRGEILARDGRPHC
jgi:hypothetical protein